MSDLKKSEQIFSAARDLAEMLNPKLKKKIEGLPCHSLALFFKLVWVYGFGSVATFVELGEAYEF